MSSTIKELLRSILATAYAQVVVLAAFVVMAFYVFAYQPAAKYIEDKFATLNSKLDNASSKDDVKLLSAKIDAANERLTQILEKIGSAPDSPPAPGLIADDIDRIKKSVVALETEFGKVSAKLARIETATQWAAGMQTAGAAFSVLSFIRDTAAAAISAAKTTAEKASILKYAEDIAVEFAKSFAGSAGESFGTAFGEWITCTGACDRAEHEKKIADILQQMQSLSCDKECKDIVATLKKIDAAGLNGLRVSIAGLKSDIANVSASQSTLSATTADIRTTVDKLPKNYADPKPSFDELKSSLDGIRTGITKLSDEHRNISPPPPGQPTTDIFVVSFAMPRGPIDLPPTPRLSVHYDRIGSVDDKGQTAAIVEKLKAVLKGRKACTIAVAGHADTLGSDAVNLNLSKRRAAQVATALKAAFANDNIPVTENGWGERLLEVWTPNNRGSKANRRVDVTVNCEA